MRIDKRGRWSRRNFFQIGAAAMFAGPAATGATAALAQAAARSQVRTKIRDVQTMLVGGGGARNFVWIKITTTDGQFGIGEAYGSPGVGVAEQIMAIAPTLIGRDPLELDRIWTLMGDAAPSLSGSRTDGNAHGLMRASSGIEMALWDLAGHIVNLPLSILMGGRFRDHVRVYDHTRPTNMFDKASCRDWAAKVKEHPSGFTAHKINIPRNISIWNAPDSDVQDNSAPPLQDDGKDQGNRFLSSSEVRRIGQGFANMREALGWDHDLMVHCHWELDVPSALRLAEVLKPVEPLWLEDPLPVDYSEGWRTLVLKSPVPIHMGENLARREGFAPFIVNQATNFVNPDLRNSGGFLETKRIADLASLFGIPTTTHNTGSQLHTYQVCQWASTIRDFVMCETNTGNGGWRDQLLTLDGPYIQKGYIKVSDRPGTGAVINRAVVEANLFPGQKWWN